MDISSYKSSLTVQEYGRRSASLYRLRPLASCGRQERQSFSASAEVRKVKYVADQKKACFDQKVISLIEGSDSLKGSPE